MNDMQADLYHLLTQFNIEIALQNPHSKANTSLCKNEPLNGVQNN